MTRSARHSDEGKADASRPPPLYAPAGRWRARSIEIEGVVVEVLPNATFRVRLENGHEIHTSGCWRATG